VRHSKNPPEIGVCRSLKSLTWDGPVLGTSKSLDFRTVRAGQKERATRKGNRDLKTLKGEQRRG
jgi:hypothetical protein